MEGLAEVNQSGQHCKGGGKHKKMGWKKRDRGLAFCGRWHSASHPQHPPGTEHSSFKVNVHHINIVSSNNRARSRCYVKGGARAKHVEKVEDKEANSDTENEEDNKEDKNHDQVELANVEETDEPKQVPGWQLASTTGLPHYDIQKRQYLQII